MTEAFVFTETDRTKSKWVSAVYRDFVKKTGRTRTTMRGLFYFALQREAPDYPICGGFVGEIRITRPYHENDGVKLDKWAGKARAMSLIPADALLDETAGKAGEQIFHPDTKEAADTHLEVWVSKASLHPLLYPVCEKHHATLVSVNGQMTAEAVRALCMRSSSPTQVLCLSDLSVKSAFFARDLREAIRMLGPEGCGSPVEVRSLGLLPEQVLELGVPMIRAGEGGRQSKDSKDGRDAFKRYLQPFGLDSSGMAEIDALEAYYPGGVAAFLDKMLSGSIIMPAA